MDSIYKQGGTFFDLASIIRDPSEFAAARAEFGFVDAQPQAKPFAETAPRYLRGRHSLRRTSSSTF